MPRTEDLTAVVDSLVGRTFGSIKVIGGGAQVSIDPDGQPSILFELVVSDPVGPQDTWPLEDVDELQSHAQQLAFDANPESPFAIVKLLPETPDQDEDGETPGHTDESGAQRRAPREEA